MDTRNLQVIRDTVFRSFECIRDSEYDFLGDRRASVLRARACLDHLLEKIHSRLVRDRSFNPWSGFTTVDDPSVFLPDTRHRSVALNDAPPPVIGVMHGSFDPFHLGHLMMGIDAVADGSAHFTVFMPNSDRCSGGSSLKPDKSSHAWRMRTVLAGGADDFYPITRVSPFGNEGDSVSAYGRLIDRNRKLVERGEGLEFVIIIGSDIVLRPDFVGWSNATYSKIQKLAPEGKLRLRFRIVERLGQNCDRSGRSVKDLLCGFDFPHIVVPDVSCASSTSVRHDKSGVAWLYPREITLLESFLLYNAGFETTHESKGDDHDIGS